MQTEIKKSNEEFKGDDLKSGAASPDFQIQEKIVDAEESIQKGELLFEEVTTGLMSIKVGI